MARALQRGGWSGRSGVRRLVLALAAGLALGSGCPSQHYRLQMQAGGGTLERSLADASPRPPGAPPARFAAAVAAELKPHYGPPGPQGELRGRFAPGALPRDPIGTAYWWLESSSPFGEVYRYQERLAGSESARGFAQQLEGSTEQAAELLGGWLREEFAADPATPQVERLLREHWLPDLRELAWLSWLHASDVLAADETEPRLAQFLLERGYLEPGPDLGALFRGAGFGALALTDLRRRGVALGPPLQSWLDAPDADAAPTFGRYLVRSERFRAWLAEPGRAEPVALAALDAFASGAAPELDADSEGLLLAYLTAHYPAAMQLHAALVGLGAQADVEATLALPEPPFASNGRWEAEQGRLYWKRSLFSGPQLSALLHASWAEPAAAFQREHFGRVLIAGEALDAYNAWYRELDPARRDAWDRFAAQLTPDPELRARLESFRFQGDAPPAADAAPGPSGAARPALRLLLDALGAAP